METIIKRLAESIKSNLLHDMRDGQYGDDVTLLVLAAYNRYQEDERDGVDYIFCIHNAEDLKCCIDGGMKIGEISELYKECTNKDITVPFFMFGQNHESFETFETWGALKVYLTNFLGRIILQMLCYHEIDGYKQLYDHCISDYMINNNLA